MNRATAHLAFRPLSCIGSSLPHSSMSVLANSVPAIPEMKLNSPRGVSSLARGRDFRQTHREYARDAIARHRDAIDCVCVGHRHAVVGDDDELRQVRELLQYLAETHDIGLI